MRKRWVAVYQVVNRIMMLYGVVVWSIFKEVVEADELVVYSSHLQGAVVDGQSIEDPLKAFLLHPVGEEVTLLEVVILSRTPYVQIHALFFLLAFGVGSLPVLWSYVDE